MPLPNNLSDAAAAVKDGSIGIIEIAQIGDVIIGALRSVSAPSRLRVTRKPVEAGYVMSDAAVEEPDDLYLQICLTNPDFSAEGLLSAAITGNPGALTATWREKKDTLYQYKSDRQLVTARTHEGSYKNRIVAEIDPIYEADENYDCFFANVIMADIRQKAGLLEGITDQAKKSVGGL
jgi:hypothetical protein